MSNPLEAYRVRRDTFALDRFDPDDTHLFCGDKDEARAALGQLNKTLETLQELLYAQRQHSLLVVLQGMDTSGKDGVIRCVFNGVNPQGVRVANFKAPSALELSHDYLWRVHVQAPAKGEIVIFNRSHYEDVLIVRVRELAPLEVWSRRYRHIREFERMLAEEGITIRKFFLHISKDEQRQRLQARLDDPTKQWKFNPDDLRERERWDDYMRAYEDALRETSDDWAPWYVVPANKKWYRDWVVASLIVESLQELRMDWPPPRPELRGLAIS